MEMFSFGSGKHSNNISIRVHSVPVIGTVQLTRTQIQSLLTGLLVIRTKCFFCPDNKDWGSTKSPLSGLNMFCPVNGCPDNGD